MLRKITVTASVLALLAGGAPAMVQQSIALSALSMPSSKIMPHEAYVRSVARSAYVWG